MNEYINILKNGLWNNNIGLVQLLGLCPLMAVTTNFINGLGLGIATTLTLVISNSLVSMVKDKLKPEIRLPVFVLLIAAVVTTIQLLMSAFFYELYLALGIFIALIVTNCGIIGRAEAFAAKQKLSYAAFDGLTMGIGFTIVLVILGSMREIIGQGTLFSNADLLFGERASNITLFLNQDYPGFLLAVLPPGAFIGLGLIIAVKNVIDQRKKAIKPVTIENTETNTVTSVN